MVKMPCCEKDSLHETEYVSLCQIFECSEYWESEEGLILTLRVGEENGER